MYSLKEASPTAEIELRACWVGLYVAAVALLTAALTLLGGLFLVALRMDMK